MTAGSLLATLRNNPGSRLIIVLMLIILADILIFDRQPGINIFLFANAVTIAILVCGRKHLSPARTALLLVFSLVACAPFLEAPSWMAIVVSMAGIAIVALSKAGLMPHNFSRLPMVMLRFALAVPRRLSGGFRIHQGLAKRQPDAAKISRHFRLWTMPLVLASGFLVLFASANPLIENALRNIELAFLLRFLNGWRMGFWLLIGVSGYAMLRPRLKRLRTRKTEGVVAAGSSEHDLFGHASLLRCLLVFNAIFAIQTVLDLAYLWGGAHLPGGMSHAQYAHRGAYPLIFTALLAAVFVLFAMRRDGPGDKSPLIRGLVHLWIAQNILLCLSSILRLDLYVEVYSLTELRVAAFIWMGLVAIGLLLILLRIMLNRTGEWLVAMSLLALTSTLYLSALVDIPAFIARFNVAHSEELSGEGVLLDLYYLSSLGPPAIPALDTYIAALPAEASEQIIYARALRDRLASTFSNRPREWAGWTLRNARLDTYLQETTIIAR